MREKKYNIINIKLPQVHDCFAKKYGESMVGPTREDSSACKYVTPMVSCGVSIDGSRETRHEASIPMRPWLLHRTVFCFHVGTGDEIYQNNNSALWWYWFCTFSSSLCGWYWFRICDPGRVATCSKTILRTCSRTVSVLVYYRGIHLGEWG